ncbi:MAG: DUF3592 domain-containing protein [Pseudomonadota bacterium]
MGRLVATLFGLPFAAVGVWMLYWTGSTFAQHQDMQSWQRVDATVHAGGYRTNRGDDSDTYLAWAEYSYNYNGRTYRSKRVAISSVADNVGDFHQALGQRLSAAAQSGQPVDAWVNTDDPADAVLDRRIRWGMQVFKTIFGLVFGGVGAVVLWAAWSKASPPAAAPDAATAGAAPWLVNPAWQGEPIRSEAKRTMRMAWVFAGFWNLVSLPLPFLLVREISEKENYLALIGLVFPIVGIGLIAWAFRVSREWWRYGPAPVELDPFPGAIGGHVGGRIRLAIPADPAQRFELTLSLIHSTEDSDSRSERAQWQHTQRVRATSLGAGSQVEFRFDVPDDLPPADAVTDSGSYHIWRLSIAAQTDGPDLNRVYQIPVYATGAQSSAVSERELEFARSEQSSFDDAAVARQFEIRRGMLYPEFVFPIGRHLGMASMGILFGGGFSVAGFLLFTKGEAPIMGSVFALVGGIILLFSLYSAGNALTITRSGAEIKTRRTWLGLPLASRAVDLMQLKQLRVAQTMSSQSGGRHTVYYSIELVDENDKGVCIGEGLRGMNEVEAMLRALRRELSLPDLPIEHKQSRRLRDKTDQRRQHADR